MRLIVDFHSRLTLTDVYFCVVDRLSCPKSSWMDRRSALHPSGESQSCVSAHAADLAIDPLRVTALSRMRSTLLEFTRFPLLPRKKGFVLTLIRITAHLCSFFKVLLQSN